MCVCMCTHNLELNIRPAVSTRKLSQYSCFFLFITHQISVAWQVPHTCNPSTWEVESGEPRAQAHLDYETISKAKSK